MCNANCIKGCTTTISVTLDASGKGTFPTTSTIEKQKIFGIGIRKNNGTDKDANGKALISAGAFSSAFMTLGKGSISYFNKISLEYFKINGNCCDLKCVDIADGLDTNQCEIIVSDPSLITAGQVVEVTFNHACC
jgi:hypothetical protein